MRSRSCRGRASRTLRPPALPLTGVGARHSDPSRLSAGPFPGRLPDPAHGPLRGTAAPRTVLVPCAGVPSQHTRVFSGAAWGPEVSSTRAASAPERVSNFRGGGTPRLPLPQGVSRVPRGGFRALGRLGRAGSLAPCPSSAPVTHTGGPRVRRVRGRERHAFPGPPVGCSTRIRSDPSRTRIRAPKSPGAAPLPRPSSDRAPGLLGPRDPAFARAAGSHQLTEARVAPDRGSGPDLGFLRLWDCGNLFRPLIGPAMCEVLWDRSLP